MGITAEILYVVLVQLGQLDVNNTILQPGESLSASIVQPSYNYLTVLMGEQCVAFVDKAHKDQYQV